MMMDYMIDEKEKFNSKISRGKTGSQTGSNRKSSKIKPEVKQNLRIYKVRSRSECICCYSCWTWDYCFCYAIFNFYPGSGKSILN